MGSRTLCALCNDAGYKLRMPEYHQGILILTSNRVGTFDEAFTSRIQVAIHYGNLTRKSRRAIWSNFITRIDESGEDANIAELERRVDELSQAAQAIRPGNALGGAG